MKTIEIKEDGKVIKTAYLQKHGGTFAPDSLKLGGENFWMMDEPPFLYKDHNGNEVMKGQQIFWVQIKEQFDIDELWTVKDTISGNTYNPEYYAIFTTKEAADQFVSENRPFEFVAEDGKVYSQDQVVYLVNKEDFDIAKMTAKNVIVGIRHNNLAFVTKQAANDYIKRHKAVLSLDMIEKWLIEDNFDLSHEITSAIYQSITDLVNEQFKPQ